MEVAESIQTMVYLKTTMYLLGFLVFTAVLNAVCTSALKDNKGRR